jgi:hypothetical protein
MGPRFVSAISVLLPVDDGTWGVCGRVPLAKGGDDPLAAFLGETEVYEQNLILPMVDDC